MPEFVSLQIHAENGTAFSEADVKGHSLLIDHNFQQAMNIHWVNSALQWMNDRSTSRHFPFRESEMINTEIDFLLQETVTFSIV